MESPGGDANDSPLLSRLREANKSLLLAAMNARDSLSEVEGALKHQDRFLAVLAHELRSPLTPIKLVATALGSITGSTDGLPRLRQTLVRQVDYLSHLVNTLDDITRIKSGKLQLDIRLTRPVDAVQMALEMVRPLAEARQQEMDVQLPMETPLVHGDLDRLVQVFSNLLLNAIKFTPEHGKISVTVTCLDACASIAIRDNGRGIPEAFQPFMFDLFAQDGTPQAHSRAGSGIGLSLVRNLVELHGGQVAISSGTGGEGCTATVTLPLVSAQ